jgi:predicted nucleotidyltransferase
VDALERVRKQVELVEELLGELETEKSYRGIERLARALKVDARRVASAVLKGVEGKSIDPPADSVAGMVEKLKRALSGKVVLALLYGGRAKGYALKGDYDVAVLMEQGCDLYKLGELVVDVAEALGVPEELVDVVCIDALPPEHALEALSGVPVIVGDPALLLDLKLKALQQLLDLEEGLRSCGVAPRSPPLRAPEGRVEERRVG